MTSPSFPPVPRRIALSMVSFFIFCKRALSVANRSQELVLGSPPPLRAATVISRMSLVKTLPRTASVLAFLCLILAHLLCPAILRPLLKDEYHIMKSKARKGSSTGMLHSVAACRYLTPFDPFLLFQQLIHFGSADEVIFTQSINSMRGI